VHDKSLWSRILTLTRAFRTPNSWI
jgi:hypothetical protein